MRMRSLSRARQVKTVNLDLSLQELHTRDRQETATLVGNYQLGSLTRRSPVPCLAESALNSNCCAKFQAPECKACSSGCAGRLRGSLVFGDGEGRPILRRRRRGSTRPARAGPQRRRLAVKWLTVAAAPALRVSQSRDA